MCGRYTLTCTPEVLADAFQFEVTPHYLRLAKRRPTARLISQHVKGFSAIGWQFSRLCTPLHKDKFIRV